MMARAAPSQSRIANGVVSSFRSLIGQGVPSGSLNLFNPSYASLFVA